jgi:hypothetical protein
VAGSVKRQRRVSKLEFGVEIGFFRKDFNHEIAIKKKSLKKPISDRLV